MSGYHTVCPSTSIASAVYTFRAKRYRPMHMYSTMCSLIDDTTTECPARWAGHTFLTTLIISGKATETLAGGARYQGFAVAKSSSLRHVPFSLDETSAANGFAKNSGGCGRAGGADLMSPRLDAGFDQALNS